MTGDRLKEAGKAHWNSGSGNNLSGFIALPGSRRVGIPDACLGELAIFWSDEPNDGDVRPLTILYFTAPENGKFSNFQRESV